MLNHPDIFRGLLKQQPEAAEGWQRLGIRIGNPDAPTTIIKVCNPYCGPCGRAHPILERLVEDNPEVQVRIIFSVTNNEADRRGTPARHLLAIAGRNDADLTRRALNEWYSTGKKDYASFAKTFPLNGELGEQAAAVDAMQKWCSETGIHFTPTIFIDGHRMPDGYDLQELEHLL